MTPTRWFEDLALGLSEISPGRTVTEADVVAFASLSGDFNALHVDAVEAAGGPFGERIAHGLLCTAIASGLFTRMALSASLQGSLIAMLAVHVKFLAPVRFGDTIAVTAAVTDLRKTQRPDRGVVTLTRVVRNQEGIVVQEIVTPMLVRRRGGTALVRPDV